MDSGITHILVIDDNPDDLRLLQLQMATAAPGSISVETAERLSQALERLEGRRFEVVLTDLALPDSEGLHTFHAVRDRAPESAIVVLSGSGDDALALQAVRDGAQDFLVKDEVTPSGLLRTIRHAIERKSLERKLREANADLERRVIRRTAQLEASNRELQNNIAAQLQSEKELRDSRRKLSFHLQHTPIGAIEWNVRFEVVEWNRAAEEIFGYLRAEALGRHARFIIPPAAVKHVEGVLAALLEQEGGVHSTNENVRKDACIIVCDWYNTPLTDDEGNFIGAVSLVQDITEKRRAEQDILRYIERLEQAMFSTVRAVSSMVEQRDSYTSGHQLRVADLAAAVGEQMGIDPDGCKGLRIIGLLHDVGKISVPAEILSKPGRLTPVEFELVKTHVQSGYEILKDIEFPWPVAQAVLQHHERLDGSGYPQGLKGEEIVSEARIMAVADVVEAMATHRPYRPTLGLDTALKEISAHTGRKYCAKAVSACVALFRDKGYRLPD